MFSVVSRKMSWEIDQTLDDPKMEIDSLSIFSLILKSQEIKLDQISFEVSDILKLD